MKIILHCLICVSFLIISASSNCSKYCICDLLQKIKRADCSSHNLISPNVDLPKAVEILDLSHNDIAILENTCFVGFHSLLNLSLTHNSLHTIYLDAFSHLNKLNSIDLSFNRLEYFDSRIFESNTKLRILILAGNKFMSLENRPLLKSKSLEYLNLQNSQINHIYPAFFEQLPSIITIDISKNLLITVNVAPFSNLDNLRILNLSGNRLNCDQSLQKTAYFLRKTLIELKVETCKFDIRSSQPMKFERMMMATTSKPITTIKDTNTNADIIWNDSSDGLLECEAKYVYEVCELYKNCMLSLNDMLTAKTMSEHGERCYNMSDLSFLFFIGLMVGVITVMAIVTCIICMTESCAKKRSATSCTRQQQFANTLSEIRFTRPHSYTRVSTRVHSSRDFSAFVLSELGWTTRHSYNGTLNYNTANMIRRISRSNLLSNRLYMSSRDRQQLLQTTDDEVQSSMYTSVEIAEEQVRPETPPPSYTDVTCTHS